MAAVERLIKASKTLEYPRFDPFRDCHVVPPREKYTRDFLEKMLDSSAFHGMAEHVLGLLLDEAAQVKNVHSRKVVASIREVRKEDDAIWVDTEVTMKHGVGSGRDRTTRSYARPDVVIWGNRFLLAIEIKRRLGVETSVHDEWQSCRLKRCALAYARREGISPTNVLVLFLTPDGRRAKDPDVVPVSCERLFDSIDRAIANDKKMKPETHRLIRSFMDLQIRS